MVLKEGFKFSSISLIPRSLIDSLCNQEKLKRLCCMSVLAHPMERAVVAQLASARLSEREVPGSIFSDFNVCFDFPLIRVAIALNNRRNTGH